MKIKSRAVLVVVLAGLMVPDVGLASSNVTWLPMSDFLDAQGSTAMFFPPVGDHLGWTDGDLVDFALIDYAGKAAQWLESQGGPDLDTTMSGYVRERDLGDGRVEIKVVLHTDNALAFAENIDDLINIDGDPGDDIAAEDFAATPTSFGEKAVDVLDGAEPSLGWSHLNLEFTKDAFEPMPDIRILLQEQVATHEPIRLNFTSQTFGTTPAGTPASLFVHQVASSDSGSLDFDVELVQLQELGPPGEDET